MLIRSHSPDRHDHGTGTQHTLIIIVIIAVTLSNINYCWIYHFINKRLAVCPTFALLPSAVFPFTFTYTSLRLLWQRNESVAAWQYDHVRLPEYQVKIYFCLTAVYWKIFCFIIQIHVLLSFKPLNYFTLKRNPLNPCFI